MTNAITTSADISQRTNVYAAREMLKHAEPAMVLEKLALTKTMPKNKAQTIAFRRPRTFDATTVPLLEGVTPNATQFGYDDESVALKQYGQVVEITDVIEDLVEDPVLQDASMMLGENIGRTMEALNYGVVKAGTSVSYANGASRAGVTDTLTLNRQRKVVQALKAQKARKITKILSGSTNYATRPVEAAYVAVGHTDLEGDIRNLPGFLPVAEYGSRSPLCEHEVGSVEDVRYVLSPDLEPFANAGGTPTGVVSSNGTNADVYPLMYFGQDAWGTVALRGAGSVEPTIIPVGQKTKDDPLAQRGYVGWKIYHAALILNQAWMQRLEVATTDLG